MVNMIVYFLTEFVSPVRIQILQTAIKRDCRECYKRDDPRAIGTQKGELSILLESRRVSRREDIDMSLREGGARAV